MGRKSSISIGDMFGYLLVVDVVPSNKSGEHSKAKCKCVCGKITFVASHIRHKIKSCGCKREELNKQPRKIGGKYKTLPYGQAAFNSFYYQYKRGAEIRGLSFLLSKEQFREISQNNCYYCGVEPLEEQWNPKKSNGKYCFNGGIKCNGIDRKNNEIGYEMMNCVACCSKCNFAKHKMSSDEFIQMCKKVAELHET